MSYALAKSPKRHLGFLLLAGGPTRGDCVFRSLPTEAEACDAAEAKHLYRLQCESEFAWAMDREALIVTREDSEIARVTDGKLHTGGFVLEATALPQKT